MFKAVFGLFAILTNTNGWIDLTEYNRVIDRDYYTSNYDYDYGYIIEKYFPKITQDEKYIEAAKYLLGSSENDNYLELSDESNEDSHSYDFSGEWS